MDPADAFEDPQRSLGDEDGASLDDGDGAPLDDGDVLDDGAEIIEIQKDQLWIRQLLLEELTGLKAKAEPAAVATAEPPAPPDVDAESSSGHARSAEEEEPIVAEVCEVEISEATEVEKLLGAKLGHLLYRSFFETKAVVGKDVSSLFSVDFKIF